MVVIAYNYFYSFIDISDTSFQFLTVWKSEKEWANSYKKSGEHLDIKID